jgi:hypothetical protein
VCHLGVKRKEELEEEEAKQPSLCPKELSLDEDETAKIPDYEQNKRLKTVAENKEAMLVSKCGLCPTQP